LGYDTIKQHLKKVGFKNPAKNLGKKTKEQKEQDKHALEQLISSLAPYFNIFKSAI